MTRPPATFSTIRVGGLAAGAVVWLLLASAIVLEHGDGTAAQWGTGAAIAVAALFTTLVAGRSVTRVLTRIVYRGITAAARRSGPGPR